MKRGIICLFILLFWGLIICTLLSRSIEKQMTVQVTTIMSASELPIDSLFIDNAGIHLYEVAMGNGWENGYRVQEVNPNEYQIENNHINLINTAEYGYIQYASKPITSGDLAQIVQQYRGKENVYLIINTSKFEILTELQTHISVTEKSKKALMLSMLGTQPYMQEQVISILSLPNETSIYNLNDVNNFFKNIPLVALLLAIIIVFVIIWGHSCILSLNPYKNKKFLIGNFIISIVLTVIFAWITRMIRLPSSLLPDKNIFNLKYYSDEFSEIFETLKDFSNVIARETIIIFKQNMLLAIGIVLFFSCQTIMTVICINPIYRWRRQGI